MQVIVEIDEELFFEARAATDIKRIDHLVEAGLTALVQRNAAIQLARLGGSAPDMQDIPRRRSKLPPRKR